MGTVPDVAMDENTPASVWSGVQRWEIPDAGNEALDRNPIPGDRDWTLGDPRPGPCPLVVHLSFGLSGSCRALGSENTGREGDLTAFPKLHSMRTKTSFSKVGLRLRSVSGV